MHCEGMTSVNLGAAAAVFMPSVGPASMSAHALQGPQPWWLQNMTLSKLKVWDRQLYSVVLLPIRLAALEALQNGKLYGPVICTCKPSSNK